MTIFAAAFCLDRSASLPEQTEISVQAHLRHPEAGPGGQLRTAKGPGFFLASWDSGAFSEPAWLEGDTNSMATLVGDPLITEAGVRLPRQKQLECLIQPDFQLQERHLSSCRGSFCVVSFDAATHRLSASTDAVGLRSLYYSVQDGILYCATALRILEALPELRKQISVQGVAEIDAFSFPLAERTPYENISILRECEVLCTDKTGVTLHNYYDWNAVSLPPENIEAAALQVHEIFSEAVRIRAASDQHVYSFLSGGMDSRAIAAMLLSQGKTVEALNFSTDNSQDQLFAQKFSDEFKGQCNLHCLAGGSFPNFSFLAAAAKMALESRQATGVDRPQFIWSGDGGSVGLGHVYMDEAMLDLAEKDDMAGAMQHFIQFNRVALGNRALNRRYRNEVPARLSRALTQEIHRYPRADRGRRIYLFLLFNDQRRHLFKHFETIDRHGLELLTPFYDAALLKAVASFPSRWGILHRLYAKWFEHLPAAATRTPWQTYPGHVPCPVSSDVAASYQWADRGKAYRATAGERFQIAATMVSTFQQDWQPAIFSPARVWLAAALHASGLRDCRHVLTALQNFQSYSTVGKYQAPVVRT